MSFFAECYLVDNQWEKNYNYIIDLFVHTNSIYEKMSPADALMMYELPYPFFTDVLQKQLDAHKKEQKRMEDLKNKMGRKKK